MIVLNIDPNGSYTPLEVAAMFQRTVHTVRQWLGRQVNRLDSYKIGGRRLVKGSALLRFIGEGVPEDDGEYDAAMKQIRELHGVA